MKNKKHIYKRIIACLLVVLMLLPSVPMSVFAAAEGEAVTENTPSVTYDDETSTLNAQTEDPAQLTISAGETIRVTVEEGSLTFIKFVPQMTGCFVLTSLSDDDTRCYLYDEEKNQLDSDDDGGNGSNFSLLYELEAGKTYYYGVEFFGGSRSGSFDVFLKSLNFDSVSFTLASPITVTQGVDGYVDSAWVFDEENNIEYKDEWFHYYTPSIYQQGNILTVNYNDERGSVDYVFDSSQSAFVSDDGDRIEKNDVSSSISQSYKNQLVLGENKITVKYINRECQVSFTVVKNPIESISFTLAEPLILTEEVNGHYVQHELYDEEKEEYYTVEWFLYYAPSVRRNGNTLTVNYSDERGSVDYVYDNDEWEFVSADGDVLDTDTLAVDFSQSYEKQFSIGENHFTLSYAGKECQVPFTTVKNPVESFSFTPSKPIILTEGFDGYYEEKWLTDEETGEDYTAQWFRYYTPSIRKNGNTLTVNYSDERGSVDYVFDNDRWAFVSADGDEINAGKIAMDFEQSYENQLSYGENHFTLSYMNRKHEVTFTVLKNPVESISFTPVKPIILTEKVGGYYEEKCLTDEETGTDYTVKWFRYYTPSIQENGNTLTVNYSDERGSVDYVYDDALWAFVSADGNEINMDEIETVFSQSYDKQFAVGENHFTITYADAEFEAVFTIEENPIASISFTPAEPIVLLEEIDGYYDECWITDEETDADYPVKWFCYDTPSVQKSGNVLTVNYKDERGTVNYIYNADDWNFISADGDIIDGSSPNTLLEQSYENQLLPGEHTFTVKYMGHECTVPFTTAKNPVDSISFTLAEPIVLTEDVDGYYDEYWQWDDETEDKYFVGTWFCYDTPSIENAGNTITVNYNDGRGTVDYVFDDEEWAFVSEAGDKISANEVSRALEQSYENQLLPGEHTLTVKYMKRECAVPFTTVKNPIDSFSIALAEPLTLIEGVDGYTDTEWIWDEENGEVPYKWFRYYTPEIMRNGNVLTVNYNDGRGAVSYIYDREQWAFVSQSGDKIPTDAIRSYSTQSFENQLSIGEHNLTVKYMGRECAVPFTIVKNPIDSISLTFAKPLVMKEGIDGYYDEYWQWDDETEDKYFVGKWFCYYTPSIENAGNTLTVNYNDGRGTVDYVYDDDKWAFVSQDGDIVSAGAISSRFTQSYENQLLPGEHTFTVKYMGRECAVPFTTVKNPVDSISFTFARPVVLTEGMNGYYEEYRKWNEETESYEVFDTWFCYDTPSIANAGNTLTVNYNDGRGTVSYIYDSEQWAFVSQDGDKISVDDISRNLAQSYTNQLLPGEHSFTVKYMGRECAASFTTVKNPVDSISFALAKPITLTEDIDGYYEDYWKWDDELDDDYIADTWFCYDTPSIDNAGNTLTVNFGDGRGTVDYVFDADKWAFVSQSGDEISTNEVSRALEQSYQNQLSPGEHTFTVKYMGRECTASFTIVKNPVDSISFTPSKPIILTEGLDGYRKDYWHWDEETDNEYVADTWFYYYTPSVRENGNILTVNYNDGRGTVDYVYDDEEWTFVSQNGDKISMSEVSSALEQSYQNQLSPGEHTFTVKYMGRECAASFTIVKNPVESISFTPAEPITLIEGLDGYMVQHWVVDEETGKDVLAYEWFRYNTPSIYEEGDTITVNYNDGRGTVNYVFDSQRWEYVSKDGDILEDDALECSLTQSYENQLSLGEHKFTVQYAGMECEVLFTIIKNPIDSISFTPAKPIVLVQGVDGYKESHWIWDDEADDYIVDDEWFCYHTPSIYGEGNVLSVNYNDGKGTVAYQYQYNKQQERYYYYNEEYGELKYDIDSYMKQSYDNQLSIGANTFTVTVLDKECEVPFVIVPPCSHENLNTAVTENVVEATCTQTGKYDEVIYCKDCGTEISREEKVLEKLAHTPAEAVRENEVAATCSKTGSYDSVVYCSVCEAEISREAKTTEKLGHSFTNYISNNDATCTADGTKTAKCDRCDVTDTVTDTGSKLAHTPAKAVKENEKAATCTQNGSYDEVVYCSVCKAEISRNNKTIAKLAHTIVTDKAVAPTCVAAGKTEGKHCSVCKTVLVAQTAVAAKGHTVVIDKAVAPTCVAAGKTEGKHCSVCNTVITEQKTVAATGHKNTTATTKATTSKDGKIVTTCSVCKATLKSTTIYKASSIKLSKTAFTYNGKAQKPTVTVKNSKGTTLKNGTDYTVAYASGCKNTGKYSVKITFKGNYTGTKTLYFNILPGKTSSLTVTQTTTSIKATWKAVTGASGYKVTLYSAKNKAIKTVDTTKTTYTFSKLSKGTTYKVRVTAYKTIDKKKVDASVYTQLTTATKPGAPTLKVTAGTKKASLSWNKQTGASGYVVYMATSKNGKYSKLATVKGNSKVSYTKTGLTKGKTYYFKVAAYTTVDGKTITGDYSAVKSVKVK